MFFFWPSELITETEMQAIRLANFNKSDILSMDKRITTFLGQVAELVN